jgi:transposase InsO family protein
MEPWDSTKLAELCEKKNEEKDGVSTKEPQTTISRESEISLQRQPTNSEGHFRHEMMERVNETAVTDSPQASVALMSNTMSYQITPAIELGIAGCHIQAKLDTQATLNFVDSDFAFKLQIPIDADEVEVRLAVKGNSLLSKGKCSIRGTTGKLELAWVAHIVKGLSHPLILGIPFLDEYGVVIDHECKHIVLGKDIRELVPWSTLEPQPPREYDPKLFESVIGTMANNPTEKQDMLDLLKQFGDVFCAGIGRTKTARHQIEVSTNQPTKLPQYSQNPERQQEIIEHVRELEAEGLIEKSNSNWASPVVLVTKKDGTRRFCVDYRRLNKVTTSDAFPMPNLTDTLYGLGGATKFTTLDLRAGFWQVEMEPSSKKYTAFSTPAGLYQFKVLPFGLKNSPATFQRLMSEVLRGYIGRFCYVYIDDIVVFSRTHEEHLGHLSRVLARLRQHELCCNLKKCYFGNDHVLYLGHTVSVKGVAPPQEKLMAVEQYPRPQSVKELRQFLGLCSWYNNFIDRYADLAAPLTDMLQTQKRWKWTEQQENAFVHLKQLLVGSNHLHYPDYNERFYLQTDASEVGLGAVLYQLQGETRHVIAYASAKLSNTEQRYSAHERECLAILWATKKFRLFLEGRAFTLITDNQALVWLHQTKDGYSKLTRWGIQLSGFDFDVEHRPGKQNQAADALSRAPVGDAEEWIDDWDRTSPPVKQSGVCPQPILWIIDTLGDDNPWDTVRDAQHRDPVVQRIVTNLGRLDQNGEETNHRIVQGLLQLKTTNKDTSEHWAVVVPEDAVAAVIFNGHDDGLAGHPGWRQTLILIKKRFTWPSMRRDIKEYVRSCIICVRCKPVNKGPAMGLRGRIPYTPWETLSLDFMGPYPRTQRGKRYILVVTDLFTRWVELFPMSDATADRTVKLLENEVFARFGFPRNILSDNGPQFVSTLWQDSCERWGINLWTTPVYHPRANPTERRNQEIKKLSRINILAHGNHKLWDIALPRIGFCLRDRKNEATLFSPAQLLLGRELLRPGDWGMYNQDKGNGSTLVQWHEDNVERRRLVVEEATQNATRYRTARTGFATEDSVLEVDDSVMVTNHPLSNAEEGLHAGFEPKWIGPFSITRRIGHGVYTIDRIGPRGGDTKYHRSQIRLLHPRDPRFNTSIEDAVCNDTGATARSEHQPRGPETARQEGEESVRDRPPRRLAADP